jgi:hypothetical protein
MLEITQFVPPDIAIIEAKRRGLGSDSAAMSFALPFPSLLVAALADGNPSIIQWRSPHLTNGKSSHSLHLENFRSTRYILVGLCYY